MVRSFGKEISKEMKKKEIFCVLAASLFISNFISVSPVSAVDYSFIQKVEPLQYDWEFQQELKEDKAIKNGKPDTRWFDSEDQRKEYEISTEEELMGLSQLVSTREFNWQVNEVYTFKGITIKLMNDIELTKDWIPIGYSDIYAFEGTFEGNGHTISGIHIENPDDDNQGFFGYLKGTVRNLNLSGSIETETSTVGGLAAVMAPDSSVENCTVDMNVSGRDKVGGVVGQSTSARIEDCHNKGNVSGTVKVGGVVGENWNGSVVQCSNTGTISSSGRGVGTYGTGGIAGRSVARDAVIRECYNTGSIRSNNECTGGIVGYTNASGSTVESCYNTGTVSGVKGTSSLANYVGGIVGSIGENGVRLRNCYNVGAVKNGEYLGGVLGNFTANYYANIETYISNNYYLDESAPVAVGKEKDGEGEKSYSNVASVELSGDLRSTHMAAALGSAYRPDQGGLHGVNNGFPVLTWQEETTIDRKTLLKKMKINYKKEFNAFFDAHPYGTASGQFILELSNPHVFFERQLSDQKARAEERAEKEAAAE